MNPAARGLPYPSLRNDRIGRAIAPGAAVGISTALASTGTAQEIGIHPFIGIRCDLCKAGLHDEHGNPRWEVRGKDPLLFICPDGCKETK